VDLLSPGLSEADDALTAAERPPGPQGLPKSQQSCQREKHNGQKERVSHLVRKSRGHNYETADEPDARAGHVAAS
jgi:hypothetical protein